MPKGNRYQWIYNKLNRLTGNVKQFAEQPGNTLKLQSEGFMDLIIESLGDNIISLAHYYQQNGDSIPDPDMTVRIHDHGMAEALTFQDSSQFLNFWLTNLEKQGFYRD